MSETTFCNGPIDVSALPSASHLNYEGLASSYARTMIIEWGVGALLLGTGLTVLDFFVNETMIVQRFPWIVAPYLIALLSVFAWAPLIANSRGYSVREKDIHYKSGVIWRKTVSLPFNRIQHIELESGPLERLFKLTTLKFFTAGGGHADMKIPALTFTKASKLRAYVVEKAGVDEKEHAAAVLAESKNE